MKTNLLIITFLLSTIGFGQETTFTYMSYKKYKRSNIDSYSLPELDENGCLETVTSHTALILEIPTFDPELSDAEKEEELIKLDSKIDQIAALVICPSIKTIVLVVGEAAFLRSTDNYERYSKNYFKKFCTINAKRFWERYKSKFSTQFPGKSIVYTDWNW